MSLLEVAGLTKDFHGRHRRPSRVVDDVSFDLDVGSTLGLVGESGAGKSTTARLVLRLIEPTAGIVRFDGTDLTAASKRELRTLRRSMQIVFQDPHGSFDPRLDIGVSVAEPLLLHTDHNAATRRRLSLDMLERVGLEAVHADRQPRHLSGGQLQRAAIARALVSSPRLLVCDEPTAALDVSVQAQVVNLLLDLQADMGIAILFISHDLPLVRQVADRVAVMRDGRIVELGSTEATFARPVDEYTATLLAASLAIPIATGPPDTPAWATQTAADSTISISCRGI